MKTSVSRIIVSVVLAAAAVSAIAGTKEDIQADMKAGRWSQADTRLTETLAKHPDNALAHYWQAQVKFRENQLDEARKHLSAAKELDPQYKFASDKASLSKLEAALDKTVATPLPKLDNPAPKQTLPARVDTPPPAPYKEPKSSGGGWLWIGLIVLAVFIFWAVRSAKSRGMSGDKAAIKGKLEEALNDLRDAGKFIDTRADLTMEQKLAMSDRVMRAQGDVQAHLATLATRDDLQPSIDLWRRVRDIAAETRGERRPSEIEAEREMELQRMRQTQMANQNMGMPNQGGGGFGGAGAALGGLAAGVVLGSMMSGGAQAHERRDSGGGGGSGGYTPIEDFDRGDSSPSIDVGGSGDGGGWDSGGSDTGGGGSDSFD
jgi:tetratricopeptide (TPR) repeat protein